MKRVNGIIVEATETELKEIWLSSNWSKTASFESFKRLMIDVGCIVTEVKKECEKNSAEVVQQKISVEKKSVTACQQKKDKTIVSDISGVPQKETDVKVVSTETDAKIQPIEEVKKNTIIPSTT